MHVSQHHLFVSNVIVKDAATKKTRTTYYERRLIESSRPSVWVGKRTTKASFMRQWNEAFAKVVVLA